MTRPSKFYDSYDDCNFPNKIIEREREKNFIKPITKTVQTRCTIK